MKISRLVILVLTMWLTFGLKPSLAAWDEYDDSQSHPLRVVAYLAYPAAFLTEWLVFRPFHFLVSATEPQEALFGHRPHPPVLSEPQPLHGYGRHGRFQPVRPSPSRRRRRGPRRSKNR